MNWAHHSLSLIIIHSPYFFIHSYLTRRNESFVRLYMSVTLWPFKCIIFQDFSLDYTGIGGTGTIFDLELTSDALVFWVVTETLGHYFTWKHLFSGLSTSYTQVKAVIYFVYIFHILNRFYELTCYWIIIVVNDYIDNCFHPVCPSFFLFK